MTALVKRLLACGSKTLPASTTELPGEGRIWVSVGHEERRFELDANYLNHPLLADLLRLSVDEFGYSYYGALRVACEADFFLHVLHLLASADVNPSVHYTPLHILIDRFYAGRRCGAGGGHRWSDPVSARIISHT